MSLCLLCPCVYCVPVSIVSLCLLCPCVYCVPVSLCLCVPVSLCPCVPISGCKSCSWGTFWSLCPCPPVSLCPCVPVSPCPCVPVPLCSCVRVPMSLCECISCVFMERCPAARPSPPPSCKRSQPGKTAFFHTYASPTEWQLSTHGSNVAKPNTARTASERPYLRAKESAVEAALEAPQKVRVCERAMQTSGGKRCTGMGLWPAWSHVAWQKMPHERKARLRSQPCQPSGAWGFWALSCSLRLGQAHNVTFNIDKEQFGLSHAQVTCSQNTCKVISHQTTPVKRLMVNPL